MFDINFIKIIKFWYFVFFKTISCAVHQKIFWNFLIISNNNLRVKTELSFLPIFLVNFETNLLKIVTFCHFCFFFSKYSFQFINSLPKTCTKNVFWNFLANFGYNLRGIKYTSYFYTFLSNYRIFHSVTFSKISGCKFW